MSTTVFRRPARQAGPQIPQGELALQEPPSQPEQQGADLSSVLMYLPMAAGSAVTMMMFSRPGMGGGGKTLTYVGAGLMGVSMLGMLIAQLVRTAGQRKRKMKGERRDYLRYLGQMRGKVRKAIGQQREALLWDRPEPEALWSVAASGRLWERRSGHDDFGEVRIATGAQEAAVKLQPPQTKPVEDLEPLCARALRRFIRGYATVPDLPISVFLRGFGRILVRGDAAASRAMVRAVVAQLATLHSPDDLRIALCVGEGQRAEWEWAKWLPHALHPVQEDVSGPMRLLASDYFALEPLLGAEFAERSRFDRSAVPNAAEPYVLVIVDGGTVSAGSRFSGAGVRNATVLDVSGALPWRADRITMRLQVEPEKVQAVGSDRTGKDTFAPVGRPDALSVPRAEALARMLAPHRLGGAAEAADPMQGSFDLTSLLGVGDPHQVDAYALWQARSVWDQLRVPIGVSTNGAPVELDIRESAQGGMGPHGMLIGATGSGKSELLRTLVLSLAVTHSPEVLNFVLVDFKGGATFLGLGELPHTSAVITNLADELTLVDRMQDALQGELVRRQEVLRQSGYASLRDYEQARAKGVALDPLPTLFVVVDEFSELLAAKPEFMDLFVMIGRLGRSLGVHLLLATQRLDSGRIHHLESHLSYRIALRTFSASESSSVLGVPDAHTLPPTPGSGYLKTDTSTLIRFKAAYVSGPYRAPQVRGAQSTPAAMVQRQVVAYGIGNQEPRALAPAEPDGTPEPQPVTGYSGAESLLEILVDRMRNKGATAHQVWLPPLTEPMSLDRLLPPLEPDPDYGLAPAGYAGSTGLRVPLGIVDLPAEQRRELLLADLAGGAGHIGIVGGPQSGKSTLVRTLLCSLALTHTPLNAQFYCLDLSGGSLGSLSGLPHTGGVASRLDKDRVTRTVAEVAGALAWRERIFTERGIDSMALYRRLRATGEVQDDPWGDIFLVIDGWFTFRQEFENLEPVLTDIATRGLTYGIHLVVTSGRWTEIRPWLRDLLGTRFELRLGDPIDSEVDTRAAAGVPAVPGRGLTRDRRHFLAALPRIDGGYVAEDLSEATRDLVAEIAESWHGHTAPPVRMLPTELPAAQLPAPDGDIRLTLGIDEQNLAPVVHDFETSPHLMVFGDTESGKSNLLRLIGQGIAQRYGPDGARVILADPRRSMYDCVPTEQQLGYAVTTDALTEVAGGITQSLRKRLPGPNVTPEQIRRRDWWSGPRLFLLLDDYDLLATSSMGGPLQPLLELLPQAADIGFHLIVARASSGASRAMMDPVFRRLWELGTPGVLLSCSREEGKFLGDATPRQLPPGRAQYVTRRRAPLLIQTGHTS
ncbi:type VII secretion protein EccCa [Streptomyces sp. 8N616]|uniref:type VII secretion protein EccCa n=1 Tax=Streptomyces sp. 8N616 TaxID=3457414 RepID=UPI003FD41DFB